MSQSEENHMTLKKFLAGSLFFFLFSNSMISAEAGNFEIQVEYLFLKPSFEQSYYAIFSSTFATPNGSRVNNEPDFYSAFRVGGVYNFCNCKNDLNIRYTYLNGNSKDSVEGTFLFNTQGFPGNGVQIGQPITGFINSDLNFKYCAGDVVFGQLLINDCPFNLSLFGGLHAAYIRFRENIFTFESTISFSNTLEEKSHLWGIGTEIGINFQYFFPQFCGGWLSIIGNARGSLLISKTDAELQFTTASPGGGSTRNIHNKDIWRAIPVFDLAVGLNYDYPFRCFNLSLEIGYEAINYRNAINTIVFVDDTYPGNSLDVYSDLSIHGPYVALDISF